MGNVLAPLVAPLATLALSHFFQRPDRENPTLADIHARHRAEQAQRQSERAAREAYELAQQIQRRADLDREQARLRREEAERVAARAAEEAGRMRAQVEEAKCAARHLCALAEAAEDIAREEAASLARAVREERERAQRIREVMTEGMANVNQERALAQIVREDAQRAMTAARDEALRAQKMADEAEAGVARAEEMVRAAAEETRKAMEVKEEAEKRLKEGIRPIITPSPEEVAAAKRRIQYKEDCFHFAITGVSGSGKSSLVNAFRGLRSGDAGSAVVGITETTHQMTRFADTNPENPYVWYDIPGAGTINCRDWQYFNDQGLYVFDCIIVLFGDRFTMTDIAILVNAKRFNIPTYIVRSKADQHIRNMMMDMGYDSNEDSREDVERRTYMAARTRFVEETRRSVRSNLEEANLPDQRVYIVSNTSILSIVLNKMPKRTVDEVELLDDLLNQAYSRRVAR